MWKVLSAKFLVGSFDCHTCTCTGTGTGTGTDTGTYTNCSFTMEVSKRAFI